MNNLRDRENTIARSNAIDFDLIEEIMYLAHVEDRSNHEIGAALNKSPSSISRIRSKFEEEYLIKIIDLPPRKLYEKRLEKEIGIRKVKVVSRGKGKNSHSLGYAAARYITTLLIQLFETKDSVNIGISCGASVRFTCERIVEEIKDKRICLHGKTINIFPSAIIGGNSFSVISPSFTATNLANKLLMLPREIMLDAKCYRSILPSFYYSKETSGTERDTIRKYCGYRSIMPDPVNTLDILLAGVGRAQDEEFLNACHQTGILKNKKDFDDEMSEINFQPIDKNGNPIKYDVDVEGITLDQMREMSRKEDKHIIALLGGKTKQSISRSAFNVPRFNTLFTDSDIGDYWLKEKSS